jgi:hypothetical protein
MAVLAWGARRAASLHLAAQVIQEINAGDVIEVYEEHEIARKL